LFDNGKLDYVITSDLIIRGSTGTSGRPENITVEQLNYYNLSMKYAQENGSLIKEIDGGIYGKIKREKT